MTNIVKQHAAIALLITILSNFSDCEYCPVSAPTLSVVSKCPTTKTEWDEAASRKKCNLMSAKCGDKTAVYHCLLNQWRNETVEVCASTWYISGFCVIYNTEEMKVIDDFNRDCTNFTEDPCPTRYISTDAYMYQGCYEKRNTSTSLPSTDKQVHVSTDCTLPAAIIAIIIVLLLLSLVFLLLLVLTCHGKISKSVMDRQCMRMRLCKQTDDEETDLERSQDSSTDEKMINTENESLLPGDLERRPDSSTDEKIINTETESLLPGDQKSVSTPTDKREKENNTMSVNELVKQIESENKVKETDKKKEDKRKKPGQNLKTLDASDSSIDTSKKDENLLRVIKEESKPTSYERTDSPKYDRKSESNVKDPSDNMKDLNTKNEDLNKESVEEGKVIVDGGTDSPDDDRKLECIDKVEQEDDRLHENDSKDERTDSPKHDPKGESNVKDPSDNMKYLNTKNEDLNKESVEEGKVIFDERTDSPKHDPKSESNVKDPSDNMKDLNTRNEDLNKESVEEGKVIFDGGTDSPDDDRKLECIDKVEQEDDRLHENDSKDIKSSSSTSNEKKNSTEKEEQFDPIEKPPLVRARVEKFQKMMNKHN